MDALTRKSLVGLVNLQIVLGLLLFVPAGTVLYWEAWVYWCVFGGCCLATTLYFLKHDRRLIEARLQAGPSAEARPRQKVIQLLASLVSCAVIIVPGLEHRWHGSSVPAALELAGNALVAVSMALIFEVFRTNSTAFATVKAEQGQQVITTGLYGRVRHPMYASALLLFAATPLALGSYWALCPALLILAVLVARLRDEERLLLAELPGYEDYCRQVRYRLVPGLW